MSDALLLSKRENYLPLVMNTSLRVKFWGTLRQGGSVLACLSFAFLVAACGGTSGEAPAAPTVADPWAAVTSTVQEAQSQFPAGLVLEVITPAGVVYSRSFGGFSNTSFVPVASASKMVSATVFLRLVEQGMLSLDTTTKSLLLDRQGRPWSGNMGNLRLRDLLSFTAGIVADVAASDDPAITTAESVLRIYEDQSATASPPGSYFYYGGKTQMRIAARMAEVATGKSWRQLYDEQLRIPLGFGALSTFANGTNPGPASDLVCTGLEYTRFLAMQLRQGLDGGNRLLSTNSIQQQRADAFGAATTIAYSAYTFLGKAYHYGFGNWLETADGRAPSSSNPVIRWSSTGKFGWAPWIASDSTYAGLVMTLQPDALTSFVPSENLKAALDPLIRGALQLNPPVVRTVP